MSVLHLMRSSASLIAACAGITTTLGLSTTAQAAPVSIAFTKIADTSGEFTILGEASLNNNGDVVFWANFNIVGGEGSVHVGDGGPTTTIADTSGSFFSSTRGPSINDAGAVAFQASLDGGGDEINRRNGAVTTTIADTSGRFSLLGFSTSINNEGDVAFQGQSDGETSIRVGNDSSITTIADTAGEFMAFNAVSINDSDDVAFIARLDAGGQSIHVGSGGDLKAIADTVGAFSGFGGLSFNDLGDVVFGGDLDAGGDTLNVNRGGVTTTIADTTGEFFSFGKTSINNAGDIAFTAALDSDEQSLNIFINGMLSTILSTGDLLDGLVLRRFFSDLTPSMIIVNSLFLCGSRTSHAQYTASPSAKFHCRPRYPCSSPGSRVLAHWHTNVTAQSNFSVDVE